jgi:hypothetical protein
MYIIYGYISGMEIIKSPSAISLTLLCEFAFDGNLFILTFLYSAYLSSTIFLLTWVDSFYPEPQLKEISVEHHNGELYLNLSV